MPNLSITTTDKPEDGADSRDEGLAFVEIIVQGLIFVLALFGNLFVLYALYQQKRVRPWSRVYFFMAHLSIADLLVALFNILPQLIWDITFRFKAGDVMCRLIKYLQIFVLYLSTYILVAMSMDRYLAVTRWLPSNPANSLIVLLVMAWVLSFFFALPQVFIFSVKEVKPEIVDCWATFGSTLNLKTYVSWFVFSIFGCPLAIIALCYGAICYKIWKYKPLESGPVAVRYIAPTQGNTEVGLAPKESPGVTSDSTRVRFEEREEELGPSTISEAKMKTIKLTLTVVVCFFLCWSPFCITQLYMAFDPPLKESDVGPLQTILLLLASLNSCANPWIYLAFSESLLNHLRYMVGMGRKSNQSDHSVGDEEPLEAQRGEKHFILGNVPQKGKKLSEPRETASTVLR